MAKCDRCDKEMREAGVLPSLDLKALGLYPTHHMTMGMVRSTIVVGADFTNADIGTADIVIDPANTFLSPTTLHRLPGRPINAYPLINGVAVRVRGTAGAFGTAARMSFALKFRDLMEREHIALTSLLLTDTTIGEAALPDASIAPIISAMQLGEKPQKFGTWSLEGTILRGGTITELTFYIYANLGILYGSPSQ